MGAESKMLGDPEEDLFDEILSIKGCDYWKILATSDGGEGKRQISSRGPEWLCSTNPTNRHYQRVVAGKPSAEANRVAGAASGSWDPSI